MHDNVFWVNSTGWIDHNDLQSTNGHPICFLSFSTPRTLVLDENLIARTPCEGEKSLIIPTHMRFLNLARCGSFIYLFFNHDDLLKQFPYYRLSFYLFLYPISRGKKRKKSIVAPPSGRQSNEKIYMFLSSNRFFKTWSMVLLDAQVINFQTVTGQ